MSFMLLPPQDVGAADAPPEGPEEDKGSRSSRELHNRWTVRDVNFCQDEIKCVHFDYVKQVTDSVAASAADVASAGVPSARGGSRVGTAEADLAGVEVGETLLVGDP